MTQRLGLAGIFGGASKQEPDLFVEKRICVENDAVPRADVVARVVLGWAPEVYNLPSIKSGGQQTENDLKKLEYIINWGVMTLQDATDFCILATRTTESIQRFSDGTILQPGGIPGVGGEIDVAAITPGKGFCWLKRKLLSIDGDRIDIDSEHSIS